MKVLAQAQALTSDTSQGATKPISGEGSSPSTVFSLANGDVRLPQQPKEHSASDGSDAEQSEANTLLEITQTSTESEQDEGLLTLADATIEPEVSMHYSQDLRFSLRLSLSAQPADTAPTSLSSTPVSGVPQEALVAGLNKADAVANATIVQPSNSRDAVALPSSALGLNSADSRPKGSAPLTLESIPKDSLVKTDSAPSSSASHVPVNGNSQMSSSSQTLSLLSQSNSHLLSIAPALSDSTHTNTGDTAAFRSLFHSTAASTDSVSQWKADALGQNPVQWGQKLLTMLSDKVQLQVGQHLQKAQIRLDPPNLGTIDISISVENDKTTVNLVASHQQVREALQQTIDQLRQHLGAKLSSEVSVSTQAESDAKGDPKGSFGTQQDIEIAGQWHEGPSDSHNLGQPAAREWLNRLV